MRSKMANSVLVLSWGSAKLALLAIVAIALLSSLAPFLHLHLPPTSFDSLLLLLSSLLTPGSVFVLANFIVLAILISSGFLQPSNFFASSTSFPPQPGFDKPLSRKITQFRDDPLKNNVRSQPLADIPAVPLRKQSVIVPESSSQYSTRIIDPDRSHLHLVQKLPLATANHQATKEPKPSAFATSAATGARIVRSTSDKGVRPMVAADRGRTLRKAETMNSISVVWRSPDCDYLYSSSMQVTDRLLITNACLSPVDFHKKCEDFIAKVHLDMRKDI